MVVPEFMGMKTPLTADAPPSGKQLVILTAAIHKAADWFPATARRMPLVAMTSTEANVGGRRRHQG